MTNTVLIVAVFLWPFLALCVALVLGIALLDCFASTVDREAPEKPGPGLVETAHPGTLTAVNARNGMRLRVVYRVEEH